MPDIIKRYYHDTHPLKKLIKAKNNFIFKTQSTHETKLLSTHEIHFERYETKIMTQASQNRFMLKAGSLIKCVGFW